MITTLVKSAFQTGCLSVESENMLRQMIRFRECQTDELQALEQLDQAIALGTIRRETPHRPSSSLLQCSLSRQA